MIEQTRKAIGDLAAAHHHLTAGLVALESIGDHAGSGDDCACGDGRACAYHADLMKHTFEAMQHVGTVLGALGSDLVDPKRSRQP